MQKKINGASIVVSNMTPIRLASLGSAFLVFWLVALSIVVPVANAANKDPAFIKLGAGDVGSCCADRDQAGAFSIEYRAGPDLELLYIRPSLGVLGTTDASVYGWFGLSGDIFFLGGG